MGDNDNTQGNPMASQNNAMVQPVGPGVPQDTQAQGPAQPDPIASHHAMLGGALKNIAQTLEGNETSYQPDPITGEVKEVPVQRKPGSFFRDLLMGAAMGGAAATSLPRGSGGVAGAMTGMAAQMQNQDALQQRQKQEAFGVAQRAKAENDKKQAKNEEKTKQDQIAAQTVAAHTHSVIVHDSNSNLYNSDQIDKYNKSSQTLMAKLKGKALPATIQGADGEDINSKKGNGKTLAEMEKNDDGSVLGSPDPDQFHRVDFMQYDTKDLDYKNGKWVDKKGTPVNLEDYTTHNVYDIPNSQWGQNLDMSNGDWNSLAQSKIMSGDDSAMSSGTIGQAFATQTRANSGQNKDLAELTSQPKDENEALNWQSYRAQVIKRQKNGEKVTPQELQRARIKGDAADSFLQLKGNQKASEDAQAIKKAADQDKALAPQRAQDELNKFNLLAPARLAEHIAQKRADMKLDNNADGTGTGDLMSKYNIKPTDTPDQVLAKAPAEFRETLRGIREYTMDPRTFAQRIYKGQNGEIDRAKALNWVKLSDPDWDETEYNSRFKMRQDFTSGKTSQNLVALNTAVQHLDRLAGNAAALGNSNNQYYNSVKNWYLTKLKGSGKPGKVTEDANAVAGELSNIFKATGATDDEIQSWKKEIHPDMSPEQFDTFVGEGLHLMAGRVSALRDKWETGMKRPMDFKLIGQGTRNILGKLSGGQSVLDQMNITAGGAQPSAAAQQRGENNSQTNATQQLTVSLEAAKQLPSMKGKSDAEIRQAIEAAGHKVVD